MKNQIYLVSLYPNLTFITKSYPQLGLYTCRTILDILQEFLRPGHEYMWNSGTCIPYEMDPNENSDGYTSQAGCDCC